MKKETMTDAQYLALVVKHEQNPDGAKSLDEFVKRAAGPCHGTVFINWCGMTLGIEQDGYTHS